ncbi:MAG: TrkA family potassium uptake protein, partial [Actinobacteria bacterium]|nr:TrkA family potassium uptake protein [Actinomycetota bacterium]
MKGWSQHMGLRDLFTRDSPSKEDLVAERLCERSVGRFTAREMVAAGHTVTIIDNDRATLREYQSREESAGIEWHFGDACDYSVLDTVGVREADVVASVTGDDEDNLVVSLLAKQEFGVPRVVARVNNPKNYWMFNQMWGVDVSVSTPHLITSLVQEATSVGSFVRLMQLKGGKAELVEVTLAENSPAANRAIYERTIQEAEKHGMGTTATCLLIGQGRYLIG